MCTCCSRHGSRLWSLGRRRARGRSARSRRWLLLQKQNQALKLLHTQQACRSPVFLPVRSRPERRLLVAMREQRTGRPAPGQDDSVPCLLLKKSRFTAVKDRNATRIIQGIPGLICLGCREDKLCVTDGLWCRRSGGGARSRSCSRCGVRSTRLLFDRQRRVSHFRSFSDEAR